MEASPAVASARTPARGGLRERKKAKTRALIQEHALRLFLERGYDATSIEQIAEAAEVSPSTVFRYFPSKPDLVIYDDLDERMIEAFRAQPAGIGVVEALRHSVVAGFRSVGGGDLQVQLERAALLRSEPELRATMLDELARTLDEIAGLVAERSGRPADDPSVQALAGAVIGISIAAWFGSAGSRSAEEFLERMDSGMEALERGFRL